MIPFTTFAKGLVEQAFAQMQTFFYQITDPNKVRALKTKRENLTYLTRNDILNLYDTVRKVEKDRIPGIFVEAGCALGGSSITIGSAKAKNRAFYVYDAFGMIPPPSEKDEADVHVRYAEIKSGNSKGLGNDTYYGYVKNLQEEVKSNLIRFNLTLDEHQIHLIKGLFEDTLHIQEAVAFAHIDCDWYDSVRVSLLQIAPKLSQGGVMIFDDYSAWSGCRIAVDEYFRDKKGYKMTLKGGKLHVTRI